MKLRRKLTIILCLATIFALMLPQSVFAARATYNIADDQKKEYELHVWGGPEMIRDGALGVYWGDFSSNEASYKISWKKADSQNWKSVEIENPEKAADKVKSYVITGLESKQKYDIKISAILKDHNNQSVYTTPIEMTGYTHVTTPKYEPYSCTYNGKALDSTWNVQERTSLLKVYRSDSKEGEYKLVGQTDCRENKIHANFRDSQLQIVFHDTTAEPAKSYYYKAVNELTLDDGSVVKAESPRGYNLTAKNKPHGQYTAKFLNKKGTYAKTLTWKITSDKANYKTKLLKSFMLSNQPNKSGKKFENHITSVQYSYNGRTYYKMNNALTIRPGTTVYLRINMKGKQWIRKNGKDMLSCKIRYYYNDKNAYSMFTEHWCNMAIGANNKIEAYWRDYWEEIDAPVRIDNEHLDQLFMVRHLDDYSVFPTKVIQGNHVLMSWILCPFAQEYLIRYGTTEEEAKNSKPITVPKGQASYELKDLKAGTQYYIILSELIKDEDGKLVEGSRSNDTATVTIPSI